MNVPLNLVPGKKRINFKGDTTGDVCTQNKNCGFDGIRTHDLYNTCTCECFYDYQPSYNRKRIQSALAIWRGSWWCNNKIGKDILKVSTRKYWRENWYKCRKFSFAPAPKIIVEAKFFKNHEKMTSFLRRTFCLCSLCCVRAQTRKHLGKLPQSVLTYIKNFEWECFIDIRSLERFRPTNTFDRFACKRVLGSSLLSKTMKKNIRFIGFQG